MKPTRAYNKLAARERHRDHQEERRQECFASGPRVSERLPFSKCCGAPVIDLNLEKVLGPDPIFKCTRCKKKCEASPKV